MRDSALEAAIIADTEHVGAYEVYADWLLERGDPRGELISVQLARETAPGDEVLAARERELLAKHGEEWLDGLVDSTAIPPRVTWRRGFVDAASIQAYYQSADAANAYRALAALPVAVAVRHLEIGAEISHHGSRPGDTSVLEALRDAPPRALRSLTFTAFDHDVSWTHVGEIAVAGDAISTIEALTIHTGNIKLGPVHLPRLRSLSLITGGLRSHVLGDIAAQTWPHLASLVVWLGCEEYDGTCTPADTQPLLDGDVIPAVTELALCNCEFGDDLAPMVVRSKILPRLRKLDLSKGTLGAAAARAILQNADAFAHLETLDLSENYFSAAECDELARVCAAVNVSAQKTEDEYGRYVSLGE